MPQTNSTMSIADKYTEMYGNMVIKPSQLPAIDSIARRILANKARYQAIEKQTGVPWQWIGVAHYRESNLDFTKNLHNGEPLNRVTRLVPAGRGPFTSFEHSAVDALGIKGWLNRTNWSLGTQIERLEMYNGLGYRNKAGGNPYLWGGTNHYVRGKYVRDGVYSATFVDPQVGCVPILKRIDDLDIDKRSLIKNSTSLSVGKQIRALGTAVGLFLSSVFSMDTLGLWKDIWSTVNEFGKDYWFVLLALSLTVTFAYTKWIENRRMQEYQAGNYSPSGMAKGMGNVDVVGTDGNSGNAA